MVVFSLLYNKDTLETNTKNEKSQNTVEYKFYSSVLKNLSKDKIIANKDITNDELENIYKESVKENYKYDSYKIWVFSSEEKAKNANTYQIAEIRFMENILK